jgi:hypothetical protein
MKLSLGFQVISSFQNLLNDILLRILLPKFVLVFH